MKEHYLMRITLAFDGGSHDGTGSGFGSYAIVKGAKRTVTRIEFGGGMTSHEAGYDTLIMGLKTLIRQERPAEVALEIQTANQFIVNQVNGRTDQLDARMQNRRDQVASLLQQFASYNMIRVSPDRSAQMLTA